MSQNKLWQLNYFVARVLKLINENQTEQIKIYVEQRLTKFRCLIADDDKIFVLKRSSNFKEMRSFLEGLYIGYEMRDKDTGVKGSLLESVSETDMDSEDEQSERGEQFEGDSD